MSVLVHILFIIDLSYPQIATSKREQPTILLIGSLKECCGIDLVVNNAINLIQCVNTSGTVGKSDVGIVTFANEMIYNYFALSYAVNKAYAIHNSYSLMHYSDLSHIDTEDARWTKVWLLAEAMHPERGWARHMKYVVWLDADLIILDLGLRVGLVAAAHPDAHIFMSADRGSHTLVNSGAIIARVSQWSRAFLLEWWGTREERDMYSDQIRFDLLYQKPLNYSVEELRIKVAILSPDAINSDPPAMQKQRDSSQVLHLMGEASALRVRAFGAAWADICAHAASAESGAVRPLQHQLSVTRARLAGWARDVYGQQWIEALPAIRSAAATGSIDADTLRPLKRDVTRYANAVRLTDRHRRDGAEAVAVALQLALLNTERRRSHVQAHREQTGKYMSDWPESLKITLELGLQAAGEDLGSIGPGPQFDDAAAARLALLDTLEGLARELFDCTHSQQRMGVRSMQAEVASLKGVLLFGRGQADLALPHFQRQVLLASEVAEQLGAHTLVIPLERQATCLSQLGRYAEAAKLFKRSILLTENHVGASHLSIAQPLLNYGISRLQAGDSTEATRLLQRCVDTLKAHSAVLTEGNLLLMNRAMQQLAVARESNNKKVRTVSSKKSKKSKRKEEHGKSPKVEL